MPIAQIDIPFTNNVAGTQTISYLHTDHLNTPRWATNSSKQTVWSWQSDAYGTTMANEDPRNTGTKTTAPLRFPGQYFDQETGFHYNYFRTYIPDLGRYSQSDPIGLEGGWNTFVYVEGNPVRWSDAFGLEGSCESCVDRCLRNNYGHLRDYAWGFVIPTTPAVIASSFADFVVDKGGKEANRRHFQDVNKDHPSNPFTKAGNRGSRLSFGVNVLKSTKNATTGLTAFSVGFLGGGYLYCLSTCAVGYEK